MDDGNRAEIELVAEVPDDLQQLRAAPLEVVLPPTPPEARQPAVEPAAEAAIEPEAAPPVGVAANPVPAAPDHVPAAQVDVAEVVAPEPEPDPAPVTAAPALAALEPPASGQEARSSGRSAAEILAALEPVAPAGAASQIYRTDDAGARVILRARENAWVHVSSTGNDYLWVKILKPGDAFVVPDRPDLMLWTGNAGGLEVIVDGAPLPPLGPEAGVVRDVSLQPQALLRRLLPEPASGL